MKPYDPVVTVCSLCLRASCWQGEFMCDNAYGANIVRRKISTLIRVSVYNYGELQEHPEYWNNDLRTSHLPLLTVDDLKALGITDPELLELA